MSVSFNNEEMTQKSMLIKPIRTDLSTMVTILDCVRLICSVLLFCFATIACGYAVYAGITLMPTVTPDYAVYVIFISAILLLSVSEGLHVAAVQVANHDPNEYIQSYPRAANIIKYQNEGRNFQHFLIGRQIIVVFCVFVLGRCTTFDSFLTSLPSWFEGIFLYSGFVGVVFVVQVAQLTPQILSSNFPVQFLNIFGIKYVFYLCILLEKTGICYTVWLFCWFIQQTTCFKNAFCSKNEFLKSMNNLIKDNNNQKKKLNDIINCDKEIKEKINKYVTDLRNECKENVLSVIDSNNDVSDEEKMPLSNNIDVQFVHPDNNKQKKKK